MGHRLKKQNYGKPLPSRPTPRELIRILRRVHVSPETGCWLWTGHKDRHGYGQVKLRGRAHWVHRVLAQAFQGQFADGIEANHRAECLNPSCCNPDHLNGLTKSENVAEANRRRRRRGGTEAAEVMF